MDVDSMGLFSWIIAGIIIGGIARLLLPGRDPIGCLATIGLGILGAVVGGFVWREVFDRRDDISWIGATIAAMVLLFVFRSLTYRRR
ncbi:MAG TPA: GlsB/YeaQ/YmgE family stress response membrane protein [Acidimicrobiia bacterium]|nr:GlsB/YeaQ/YmgE family stress response membrane protein [Acidimicrobiia bacterium]